METLETRLNKESTEFLEKLGKVGRYTVARVYSAKPESELKVVVIGDEYRSEFNALDNLLTQNDIILTNKREGIEPELQKYSGKVKKIKFCGVTREKMAELREKYDSFKLNTIDESKYIATVTADTAEVNKGRIFERIHLYNILIPCEIEGKTTYFPNKGLLRNLEDNGISYALLMPEKIMDRNEQELYSKTVENLKSGLN